MRSLSHKLSRHTTRMLGGARRKRPPDYVALACRAVEQLLKIEKHFRPHRERIKDILEQKKRMDVWEPAFLKVFGPHKPGYVAPWLRELTAPPNPNQLRKDEKFLAETRIILGLIREKLNQR